MTGSSRRLFWAGQTVGVAIIAIGIRGLLDERLGQPASFARFFLGGVIAHDVILAPLVFVTAWLVKRLVPSLDLAGGPQRDVRLGDRRALQLPVHPWLRSPSDQRHGRAARLRPRAAGGDRVDLARHRRLAGLPAHVGVRNRRPRRRVRTSQTARRGSRRRSVRAWWGRCPGTTGARRPWSASAVRSPGGGHR